MTSSKRLGMMMVLTLGFVLSGSMTLRADSATIASNGMVVCVSPPAADAGLKILKSGGNAVDASVATAFALAVTFPQAGNIGGGGFMVVHPADGSPVAVVEYRETAPGKATREMFGPKDSRYGHKVVGVPGTVRGMALAHKKYGKLPWHDLLAPAIKLAEEGFVLDDHLASSLNALVSGSPQFPELQRVFGKNGGKDDWQSGDILVQKDLAWSLRRIAADGPDAFYKGAVSEKLVKEMESGKGLVSAQDLDGYEAKLRDPIKGSYRGHEVYGPPPPSSGGICLVEMLNILENYDLRKHGRWSPMTLHLMTEAMRRAYCDRARHIGDADFVSVPAELTTKNYARDLVSQISLERATSSASIGSDILSKLESDSTTHFSVVDKSGMAVSNTYTLEHSYGSRVVVRGAGFLLNNEMMDFNWKPGVTDRSGTIGTDANLIAPRKRMLSSQTPTIVTKGGKVLLVTGSPGGRTIINTVLNVVINVIDFDMDIKSAVDAPRSHHQWFPDVLKFEGLNEHEETVAKLKSMGHKVQNTRQGDAHSIWIDPKTGKLHGAADGRIRGKATGY